MEVLFLFQSVNILTVITYVASNNGALTHLFALLLLTVPIRVRLSSDIVKLAYVFLF